MRIAYTIHESIRRAITMLMACCFGLLSVNLVYAGMPDDRIEQIKKEYKFDTWAGNVKTSISVSSLKGFNRALAMVIKKQMKIFTPENEADQRLSLELVEDEMTSGAHIYLVVLASAREAQEEPFKEFVAHSRKPDYTLAASNTDYDVGDMCLYNLATNTPTGIVQIAGRPFIGRLYFSRGNVAVKIINNAKPGKTYIDILSLAKEIDALLCKRGGKDDIKIP